MPDDEETAASNDSAGETKPDSMDQPLRQPRAGMPAPAESVVHKGRKPMFRAE